MSWHLNAAGIEYLSDISTPFAVRQLIWGLGKAPENRSNQSPISFNRVLLFSTIVHGLAL